MCKQAAALTHAENFKQKQAFIDDCSSIFSGTIIFLNVWTVEYGFSSSNGMFSENKSMALLSNVKMWASSSCPASQRLWFSAVICFKEPNQTQIKRQFNLVNIWNYFSQLSALSLTFAILNLHVRHRRLQIWDRRKSPNSSTTVAILQIQMDAVEGRQSQPSCCHGARKLGSIESRRSRKTTSESCRASCAASSCEDLHNNTIYRGEELFQLQQQVALVSQRLQVSKLPKTTSKWDTQAPGGADEKNTFVLAVLPQLHGKK